MSPLQFSLLMKEITERADRIHRAGREQNSPEKIARARGLYTAVKMMRNAWAMEAVE
ncbi:hypothetical protein LITTLEE_90 [Mycobacterium phage LittleE]|uniref:Uncharacterized protein n=1 Tax=Mycobacterium phage LittleE TaxID=2922212 RepID=G1D3X5_9CAUD|nr:hypothetical protein FGG27_gp090 [Mycobacterium phage LittleE]AEK09472.1 hypothetical protein LITTLEE_90 [Mycobacterium phage LittleE]QGJ93720.1 hypothetical protein SEA_HANNACONDA_79 [Mycobacterium phage Hannaconda]QPO16690.1 hypothetical protein SEA_KASHFLOW_82 [Mycobacterium phage KashFlow]